MIFRVGILILLVGIASCVEGDNEKKTEAAAKDSEVELLSLTVANFDTVVQSKKAILVDFYNDFCEDCRKLEPILKKAANLLAQRSPPVTDVIAKVDVTKEKELTKYYTVNRYPGLLIFQDGKSAGDYEGEQTAEKIADFMAERANSSYKPPEKAVVTLTSANFDNFIKENKYAVVEFFAPWCGHCRKLAPEYEEAAKALKMNDPPIPLGAVDATVERQLASRYDIKGYPILKLFRNGQAFDYNGPREANGIIKYVLKNRHDAYEPAATLEDVKKALPEDLPLVLGYFPDESSPLRRNFVEATNDVRDEHTSVITTSEQVAKAYGLTGPSFVIIQPERFHSRFEAPFHKVDQVDLTSEDIKSHISKHTLPLVGHFTWNTMKYYDAVNETGVCIAFYFVDFSFDYQKGTQIWRHKLVEIAKDFKDTITFAVANEEAQEERLKSFGLAESGVDMNIGCSYKGRKYAMPEMDEFDPDHVRAFLNDVVQGKAKPYLKSQPVPGRQTGPVTVVVAKTFDELVRDPKMDVFIELYAPWCGHCKALEPKYEKLAKDAAHVKTLRIAKMDATSNDVPPGFEAPGFPTLYLMPAGSDKPIKYEGELEVKNMIAFINKNAGLEESKAWIVVEEEAKEKTKDETKKKDEL